MGEVLRELEQAIRSNDKEKITLEEELFLQKCKVRAVNTFLVTAGISSALVWGATKNRLSIFPRTSFSVGAAFALGGWTFDKSLNSCLNRILASHGTRIQSELAKIIAAKNMQNPSSAFSKLFYGEQVFTDSNPDKPSTRWRPRNFYEDYVAAVDTLEDSSFSKNPPSRSEFKQRARNNPGRDTVGGLGDVIADPLECILGYPKTSEEILDSDTASVLTRRRARDHKRRHRRQRAHHAETSLDHATSAILTA